MMIQIGGPLKINGTRYKEVNDRYQEQEDYVTNFMLEVEDFIKKS